MNSLFQAGLEIQGYLLKKEWPFCFIGGLAVNRWGKIRMTHDVDITLLTGFGNEDSFIKELLSVFPSRISDAEQFAVQNRVLLLNASNGIPADISLGGFLFEEKMIERATYHHFLPDCALLTCSAEDLIVLKAFADRPIDWMDVEGILYRSGRGLNYSLIMEQLAPLCEIKDSPEIVDKLQALIQKANE